MSNPFEKKSDVGFVKIIVIAAIVVLLFAVV